MSHFVIKKLSHFVITLVALNKLEINGRRTSKPNKKFIIDNNNNDNNNDVFTPTSAFKIFLRKYNSLYADDLDREKVSTLTTGRVV